MKVEQWKIDDVKPYEKNPRVNDSAVDAVAASIKEFGFRQPIVVRGSRVESPGLRVGRWFAHTNRSFRAVPTAFWWKGWYGWDERKPLVRLDVAGNRTEPFNRSLLPGENGFVFRQEG
ncbi:MAG: ParB N-terminal domain-containing protein [Planctomycetes bacterium]|nr:ParB N-terminal domain-containing protein [Planctomycetota bacterium]